MAQLRQDYDKFVAEDTEILVLGPEGPDKFAQYWEKENLPFTGLPDPKHTVLKNIWAGDQVIQIRPNAGAAHCR